jgi:hypothetical protein
MRYTPRLLGPALTRAARGFGALVVTGPRRAGKTTLLRRLFPTARYALLEDPDVLSRVRADPRGFLDEYKPPVILDEIQNAPELFQYVRTRLDAAPRRTGQWILAGSQEAPLMQGVTESLAGRAGIFQLLPLSMAEHAKVDVLSGGFPEVLARPAQRHVWFSSYLQSYLERDVRAVTAVKYLATYRRFLGLVATRHGQVLNRSELASPLGVSVPTISEWLSILEITGQILLVPPYSETFGKRLIKSPKLFVSDSGLAAHLLGIRTTAELARSPFAGALFEGLLASEIAKAQLNRGDRRELYYLRDRSGLEVDFIAPIAGTLWLIEAKARATVRSEDARSLVSLLGSTSAPTGRLSGVVVHYAAQSAPATQIVAPGVRALTLHAFADQLNARTRGH